MALRASSTSAPPSAFVCTCTRAASYWLSATCRLRIASSSAAWLMKPSAFNSRSRANCCWASLGWRALARALPGRPVARLHATGGASPRLAQDIGVLSTAARSSRSSSSMRMLAAPNGLPFDHRDSRHLLGHGRADRDALRRSHASARDDSLHDVAPLDVEHRDRRPEHRIAKQIERESPTAVKARARRRREPCGIAVAARNHSSHVSGCQWPAGLRIFPAQLPLSRIPR